MMMCDLHPLVAAIAIAPGSAPIRGDLLSALADVALTRGEPIRCWCLGCAPWLRTAEQSKRVEGKRP
jgi:hypothetical protein